MEYWSKMKRRGQKHVHLYYYLQPVVKYVWLKKKKKVVRLTKVSIILSDRGPVYVLKDIALAYCWEVLMYIPMYIHI